jgi:hypothetical protein
MNKKCSSPHPEERAKARISKDELPMASWFERQVLLTMRYQV